jgi:cellulose synthase (UDP-forming)
MNDTEKHLDRKGFLNGIVSKRLILLNASLATIYFGVITFGFAHGNNVLFGLLIAGEVFHLYQVLGYCYNIWSNRTDAVNSLNFVDPVDIFITVCGEPVEIVRETALAALAMDYPAFKVFLLNDGLVAKKDNYLDIINLAKELGIDCITRTMPGGAKAGNINNGLRMTTSPYFVVFDADHVPYKTFLKETMGYFADPKMGFVQTPQFYKNQSTNVITQTAWDQQTIFFGPIMKGKNRLNSAFMCGTNMVVSRKALLEAGGMCEFNIAEDFLTSLFIHAKGWKSLYVPKVLAEGLAPEDFLSYYKQQFRWTRGSLEVIFKYNPLFMKGLSWAQRFQYLISASYYMSGIVILIDLLIPLVFLFTGITAINTASMALALAFLPYILLNLYTLQRSTNFTYSYSAISFSLSSFFLQLRAIIGVLLNQKTSFSVTPKNQQHGNFAYLVIPHFIYIAVSIIGLGIGLNREGFSASLIANLSWVVINITIFLPFIRAALPRRMSAYAIEPVEQIMISKTQANENIV